MNTLLPNTQAKGLCIVLSLPEVLHSYHDLFSGSLLHVLMTTRAQPYHVHFPDEESEAQGVQLWMQAGIRLDKNPRTRTPCLEIVC